ncbi:hypothetical protein [Streptomyces roseifaciens]|uniref:hypothetical protein n=1 Tax=Streptomyces roseifaciens TaxID=1488406 RepID=UPI000A8462E6|nr:hypothetical protein [Streptomyces roseifaciens]
MTTVLSAVAALLAVPLTAAPAQAVNGDGSSAFASYNMDGTNNGARWTSEVAPMARRNPLVALQEAGSGPPSPATRDAGDRRTIDIGPRSHNQPSTVTYTRWRAGRDVYRYVYFLQTDARRVRLTGQDVWIGGRTNLATVSDTPADEVRVLENPAYDPDPSAPNDAYRSRPLLGLRFGNTWYWNTHARGGDVQGLLRQVRDFAATDTAHPNWALVGDYNLDILNRSDAEARDQSLHLRSDEALLRTNEPTYINGTRLSELDYAVTHGLPGGFTATRPDGAGADHSAVLFGRTPPLPQPAVPSHAFSMELSTPTGAVMQENADGTYGLGAPGHGNNQLWNMYTSGAYTRFLRGASGNCPSVALDAHRDVDSRIVAGPCDDPRARWTLTDPDEDVWWNEDNGGPQRWRNVAVPELCLTPSNKQVTATPCADDAGQLWWDSAAELPKNWPTAAGNVRLESAWLDHSRLRRRGNVSGTGTYTAPTPSKWWWIYWLRQERIDYGWNIEQISPYDNLVRFKSLDGTNQCLGARDEHATSLTDAVLRTCDESRGVDGAGQRWQAENYADGTVRYRNEANHLCLLGPDADRGNVRIATCNDIPAERWRVVNP